MKRLRKLQKALDPPINMKFLSEACHRLALDESGGEKVVQLARSLSQGDEPA